MRPLSQVDELILGELGRRGCVVGLAGLALEMELDYSSSHKRVKRLEALGLIAVERGAPGAPLVIRPAGEGLAA